MTSIINNPPGPKNKKEEPIFVAECLRVEIQSSIHKKMKEKNITVKDLATKMGVSQRYINSIFESETNLTVRELAKICYALGGRAYFMII